MAASARVDATAVYRMVLRAVDAACAGSMAVVAQSQPEPESPTNGTTARIIAPVITPRDRIIGVEDQPDEADVAVIVAVNVRGDRLAENVLRMSAALSAVAEALDEQRLTDDASGAFPGTDHTVQFMRARVEPDAVSADEESNMATGVVRVEGYAQRPTQTSITAP